ncbi:MAG TPA: DoxX family protein [Pseudonocardiaceae bacterium]
MLLRRLARPLLASIFIVGGINELRQPEAHAEAAKPLLDDITERAKDALPETVPTDPVTLVRVDAAVKIGAGALFAMGRAPRLAALALIGSLVPTTAAGHPFWAAENDQDRQQQLIQFIKNAGLAGGLLIAAADTEGKPSVGWRARRAAKRAGEQIQQTTSTTRDKLPV